MMLVGVAGGSHRTVGNLTNAPSKILLGRQLDGYGQAKPL
jgi:hypothetical protein